MHRRHLLATLATLPLGGLLPQAVRAAGEPTTGLYVAPQFRDSQILRVPDVVYATRTKPADLVQYTSPLTKSVEEGATELQPKLDLLIPPNASASAPQPLVIIIHGGGFVGGYKSDIRVAPVARSYSRAGYVVASLDYRLTKDQTTLEKRRQAVIWGVEDGMDAIRFLKLNAAQYFIDPTRIATIGGSAGGAISLTNGVQYDALDGAASAYPGVSSRVAAATATGATLYDYFVDKTTREKTLIDYGLDFDADDTPALMFHARPRDSSTGALWEVEVANTQASMQAAGTVCLTYPQPRGTHTVDLSVDPASDYWTGGLRPFLWQALRLAELRPAA